MTLELEVYHRMTCYFSLERKVAKSSSPALWFLVNCGQMRQLAAELAYFVSLGQSSPWFVVDLPQFGQERREGQRTTNLGLVGP